MLLLCIFIYINIDCIFSKKWIFLLYYYNRVVNCYLQIDFVYVFKSIENVEDKF